MGDMSVSVLVRAYPLLVDMFDNHVVSDPVPLLFIDNKIRALDRIMQDPDPLYTDIAKVNHRLLHMEHISLSVASRFVRATECQRRGLGKEAYPLYEKPSCLNPKKARSSHPAAPPSGTSPYFKYACYTCIFRPLLLHCMYPDIAFNAVSFLHLYLSHYHPFYTP